jgi:hypothetical protein
MEQWGVEKKWLMINQDHQAELLASGVKQSKLQRAAAERTSIDISRLPPPSQAPTSSSSSSSLLKRQFSVKNLIESKSIKSISSPVNTTPPPSNQFTADTISINNNTLYNINTNLNDHSETSMSSSKLKRSPTVTSTNFSPIKANSATGNHFFDAYAVDQHSPEYFIRKFLDPNLRSVTPKIAASLEVCLRTRSIE